MVDGIEIKAFEAASQTSLDELVGQTIDSLVGRGLIHRGDSMLKLTPNGMMLADTVACELL